MIITPLRYGPFFKHNSRPSTLRHLPQLGIFHNNGELEADIREWVRIRQPNIHGDGLFNLVPRRKTCINVFRDFVRTK